MQEPYFMNNQKISARQVKRTLTLELLGISTLLLPSLVATDSGVDGFFALTAGGGGAWLLLKFWQKHFRQTGIHSVRKRWQKSFQQSFRALWKRRSPARPESMTTALGSSGWRRSVQKRTAKTSCTASCVMEVMQKHRSQYGNI